MSTDLTVNETLVLLVLMSENRTVRNSELKTLGPTLEAGSRRKLVDLGLIEAATPTRFIELTLTEKGWDFCTNLYSGEAPAGANPATRALFTMMRGLERFMVRRDIVPAQIFAEPESGADAESAPDTEDSSDTARVTGRIRDAYARLAGRPGESIGLRALRTELLDIERGILDAALLELQLERGVSLIPQENQILLTAEDHDAALVVGTQRTHLLAIVAAR